MERPGMRNLKPSDASMRRERFGSDHPSVPAPPPRLEARVEEISGFEFESLVRRPSRPLFGRRFGSGTAIIAAAGMLLAAFVCIALSGPHAVGH
jgi:hypothetical protein